MKELVWIFMSKKFLSKYQFLKMIHLEFKVTEATLLVN